MSEVATIRIGSWLATPALNQLEDGTRSIRIEPRAMDVLVFLAWHNSAVVSVDELVASVWKGTVVGDGSVYLAIRQLRQALDDSSKGTQSYIETIPKRGYRLTVPVEHVDPEPVTPPAVPAAPAHHGSRPRLLWWAAAAVAVILAILVMTLRNGTTAVPGNSLAVLPFENLSSDPEQAYFADGITVELLNALSRVRDLRVIGSTSSFHFKDRGEDRRRVAQMLGVEHILEGSVRKSGDHVRITAQLSNARTGDHLWSETYERRLDDIFVTQDEIAKAVAGALQVKLGVGDTGRVPGMTRNVAAYDEYLRGMVLNLQWRPESFPPAIAHLQRAVALDPAFSMAWAGLNTVCVNGAFVVPAQAQEWRAKGAEALEHARALTPDAPPVLLELGIAKARSGDWLEAADLYERLEASYARYGMEDQAWGPRGVFLSSVGRVREAVPALERAQAVEPLAPAFAQFLGEAYLSDGDPAGALAEIDRGGQLEGLRGSLLRAALIVALAQQDRTEIKRRLARVPAEDGGVLSRRLAQFIDAPAGAAVEIRNLAPAASYSDKALLAQWAAYYHETELSIELLTEAVPHLSRPSVLWNPLMRDVRRLPAFKELVRDLGLVDYWRRYGWPDFCRPLGESNFACE